MTIIWWRAIAGVLMLFAVPPACVAAEGEVSLLRQVTILRDELQRAKQPWPNAVDDAITANDLAALHRALADEVFVVVQVNPEGRVKLSRNSAAAELVAGRPRLFLVKIENASGGRQMLKPLSNFVGSANNPFRLSIPRLGTLTPELAGHAVEYRLMQVTCERPGKHEITIIVEAGQGSQDLSFRAEVPVLFRVTEMPR